MDYRSPALNESPKETLLLCSFIRSILAWTSTNTSTCILSDLGALRYAQVSDYTISFSWDWSWIAEETNFVIMVWSMDCGSDLAPLSDWVLGSSDRLSLVSDFFSAALFPSTCCRLQEHVRAQEQAKGELLRDLQRCTVDSKVRGKGGYVKRNNKHVKRVPNITPVL